MSRASGAVRIFLYNWPIYVGTWGAALVLAASAAYLRAAYPSLATIATLGTLASVLAIVWSAVSLGVSLYVYDRSPLVSGAWVPALLGARPSAWATVHAGLDAEVELERVMPGACLARLDIFDPRSMTSRSIARARARTASAHATTPCHPTALPLEDASCDAVVVAFTAHEIRDHATRDGFFAEVRRALRPGGRLLVVEHLRDLPNFLAFGPGFLHFVARRDWLGCAARARLVLASETKVTPWVTALVLERPA